MGSETHPELAGKPRQQNGLDFYPLTVADFAALDDWLRADYLRGVLPAVKDDLRLRSAALNVAHGLSFGQPLSYGHNAQLEACWLSMRRGDKELTRDAAWQWIAAGATRQAAEAVLGACFDAVLVVSGLILAEEEKKPDPPPPAKTP